MTADEQAPARVTHSQQTVELTPDESWHLLASVSLGRIVFTQHALPAIRPVNHLVDEQTIIIRTHLGAAIVSPAATTEGAVVAYEADDIDPVRHTGWSVIATGMAQLISDPAAVSRYEQIPLEPWIQRSMDDIVVIRPQIITGLRLMSGCH